MKSTPSKQGTGKISLRLKVNNFLPKKPKSGNLSKKCSKTNVRFETGTFEIGYWQNFVKISKLIRFGPKCLNLGIWAPNFHKPMSNLKSGPLKCGSYEI